MNANPLRLFSPRVKQEEMKKGLERKKAEAHHPAVLSKMFCDQLHVLYRDFICNIISYNIFFHTVCIYVPS